MNYYILFRHKRSMIKSSCNSSRKNFKARVICVFTVFTVISNSSATEPTSSAHELLQSLYLIGSVTFAHRLDLVVDRGAGIFSVIFSVVPLPVPVPVPVPAPLGQSSPSPSPSPSHNSLYTDLTAHHHHHHHYHYHYN